MVPYLPHLPHMFMVPIFFETTNEKMVRPVLQGLENNPPSIVSEKGGYVPGFTGVYREWPSAQNQIFNVSINVFIGSHTIWDQLC